MSVRNPKVLAVWGQDGTRVIAAESYWAQPLKWDADAARMRELHSRHPEISEPYQRPRVFCASLADVFEGEDSMPPASRVPVRLARLRLFDLIRRTPNLDWMLLTKRPQNVMHLVERAALDCPKPGETCEILNCWLRGIGSHRAGNAPDNIWLGTSTEDQAAMDQRSENLRRCPAAVRFYSIEPLIGPISRLPLDGISLVIVGGESGPHARPMHPDWVRSIRDQCQSHHVPFFFKQVGEWSWDNTASDHRAVVGIDGKWTRGLPYGYGSDYPRCQELWRVGKKMAGRILDGREWNEFPQPSPVAS